MLDRVEPHSIWDRLPTVSHNIGQPLLVFFTFSVAAIVEGYLPGVLPRQVNVLYGRFGRVDTHCEATIGNEVEIFVIWAWIILNNIFDFILIPFLKWVKRCELRLSFELALELYITVFMEKEVNCAFEVARLLDDLDYTELFLQFWTSHLQCYWFPSRVLAATIAEFLAATW